MPDARAEGLTITRLSDRPADLGESPVWDDETGRLWWIDGVRGRVVSRTLTGETTEVQLDGHVGSIALAEGGLVVVLDHRIVRLDPASGAQVPLLTLADADPMMRLNDGKTDRQGRFICAGMGRNGDPLGALHQIDGVGRHRILATGISVGNGVCVSPDGTTLYYSDTRARKVFACDYDPETGDASAPRVHIDGEPVGSGVDGATVDRDGTLWAALIHSSEIAAFAPDGRLAHRFPAPVDFPSSLAFGGPDMTTLFLTSIRDSGTGRAVSKHPDGGHLFAIDGMGVTGLPEARFGSGPATEGADT